MTRFFFALVVSLSAFLMHPLLVTAQDDGDEIETQSDQSSASSDESDSAQSGGSSQDDSGWDQMAEGRDEDE